MAARRAGLLALVAAVVLAACAPERVFTPRLTSDLAVTPTAQGEPASQGQPSTGGVQLSPEQGVGLIGQAYLLLLGAHVESPDPEVLLQAAWDGMAGALPAGQTRPELPALTGTDPREDLLRFRTAYLAAVAPAGGDTQAQLAHAAVRHMAESLHDCHTAFSEPQQVAEQEARLRGEVRFAGVGIRIKRKPGEPIIIWEILERGSAAKAGLKPGDAILKIAGRDPGQLPLDQVAVLIRGEEGSKVQLTIERADGRTVQEVSLKRVQVAEPPFKGSLLPGNVAYLRLYSFSQNGETEFLRAIREYESKNPRGWIIDLRTNGGGELRVLLSLLSKFLKIGPFAYEVDRGGQRAALGPDGSFLPRQRPLVLLVSDTTSSAAELFAAAVQHYGAGKVVGMKTAGCLGIGSRYALPDGSGLSITVRKVLGPAGAELNKVGVMPDEVVDVTRMDLASGKDPQLARALAILGAAGTQRGGTPRP